MNLVIISMPILWRDTSREMHLFQRRDPYHERSVSCACVQPPVQLQLRYIKRFIHRRFLENDLGTEGVGNCNDNSGSGAR